MKFGDCLNMKVSNYSVLPFKIHYRQHYFDSTFKVDMAKVKLDVLRPWISKKITDILHIEDDVVVEFVYNQLEEEKVINGARVAVSVFFNCDNNLLCIRAVPMSEKDADQHDRFSKRKERSSIHE